MVPVHFRKRLPPAQVDEETPAELADARNLRLAAERQGRDAGGASFGETVDVGFLRQSSPPAGPKLNLPRVKSTPPRTAIARDCPEVLPWFSSVRMPSGTARERRPGTCPK